MKRITSSALRLFKLYSFLFLVLASFSAYATDFQSQHVLVVDDESGEIIVEKNADEQTSIASLTKLMTAMVVIDSKPDFEQLIRIEKSDVDRLKHSRSKIPVGEEFSRLELLQLALMSSDNRAASALARTYPGGLEAFKNAVNWKLQTLGMRKTTIDEPTGLSSQNTSTASDLMKMAIAASKYPLIQEITTETSDEFDVRGRTRIFHNTNRLIGKSGWDVLMSKTGFTNEAGNCLIMKLKLAKRTATLVLLNAKAKSHRIRDAMKIRKILQKDPI